MIDLAIRILVFIDNGKGGASYRVPDSFEMTQRVNKGRLACSHVTMKGKDLFRRELPPELTGSRSYFLQMKVELHAVKIVVTLQLIWKPLTGKLRG